MTHEKFTNDTVLAALDGSHRPLLPPRGTAAPCSSPITCVDTGSRMRQELADGAELVVSRLM